jgi:hypothetical protein
MVDAKKPNFVEAAIYMASDGEHAGHFVATCAKDECGYFGTLSYTVGVDCLHMLLHSTVRKMLRQTRPRQMLRPSRYVIVLANGRLYLTTHAAPGETVPARVTHTSEARVIITASNTRPLKRTYAMLGMDIKLFVAYKLIVTIPIRRDCRRYPSASPSRPSTISQDERATGETRCPREARYL